MCDEEDIRSTLEAITDAVCNHENPFFDKMVRETISTIFSEQVSVLLTLKSDGVYLCVLESFYESESSEFSLSELIGQEIDGLIEGKQNRPELKKYADFFKSMADNINKALDDAAKQGE